MGPITTYGTINGAAEGCCTRSVQKEIRNVKRGGVRGGVPFVSKMQLLVIVIFGLLMLLLPLLGSWNTTTPGVIMPLLEGAITSPSEQRKLPAAAESVANTVVRTPDISFVGAHCKLSGHEEGQLSSVRAFRGIPFAEPPQGSLRFHAPVPYDWKKKNNGSSELGRANTFDATEFCAPCFQFFGNRSNEHSSEDCLCLNVFAPSPSEGYEESSSNRSPLLLPVMVFFHGGFYLMGDSSQYDGCDMLQSDEDNADLDNSKRRRRNTMRRMPRNNNIILVTANYRLGPLGFLYEGDDEVEEEQQQQQGGRRGGDKSAARGNYGYLDQVAVLEWVARYISFFGGDAKKVTIWGQSAGAHSVMLHLVGGPSNKLFNRAIAMSPRAEHFMTPEAAIRSAEELKRAIECGPSKSMRECIGSAQNSTAIILRIARCTQDPACALIQSGMRGSSSSILGSINFMPVINTSFFPMQPIDMIRSSLVHTNIEGIIVGTNTYEGNLFQAQDAAAWWRLRNTPGYSPHFDRKTTNLTSWDFHTVSERLWGAEIGQKAGKIYDWAKYYRDVGHNRYVLQHNDKEYDVLDFQRIGQAYGEFMYTCGCRRIARTLRSANPHISLFKYLFAHMPASFLRHANQVCWNATHATNVPFAFNSPNAAFHLEAFSKEERLLADAFSAALISFATADGADLSRTMQLHHGWEEWGQETAQSSSPSASYEPPFREGNMMFIAESSSSSLRSIPRSITEETASSSHMIPSCFDWPGNPLRGSDTCEGLWR